MRPMLSYNDTNTQDIAFPREKFDNDLEFGKLWEGYLGTMLQGNRMEVKAERGLSVQLDKRTWVQSQNMFIEHESRGKKSGLDVTKAEVWGQVLLIDKEPFCTILMNTEMLRASIEYLDNLPIVKGGDDGTSRGWLLPINQLFDNAKEIMNAHKATSATRPETQPEYQTALPFPSASQA